jgi:uncharacterized protein (UPF0548 family)
VHPVIRLGAPSAAGIDQLLERSRHADLNYLDVGMTRQDRADRIPAYRQTLFQTTLRGQDAFERARDALRTWRVHEGAGVTVHSDPFAEDATVLLTLRIGPLAAIGPGRIVYVLDEASLFGFAYGTLTGHPERGEQRFLLEVRDPTTTTFSIKALSRPAGAITRLSGPVSRGMQDRVARRYLSSMERAALTG